MRVSDWTGRPHAEAEIERSGVVTIGRDSRCDIAIRDGTIARRHCAVVADGGVAVIVDLESTGGIERDGKRVDGELLSPTDVVHLTDYRLVVSGCAAPDPETLARVLRQTEVQPLMLAVLARSYPNEVFASPGFRPEALTQYPQYLDVEVLRRLCEHVDAERLREKLRGHRLAKARRLAEIAWGD